MAPGSRSATPFAGPERPHQPDAPARDEVIPRWRVGLVCGRFWKCDARGRKLNGLTAGLRRAGSKSPCAPQTGSVSSRGDWDMKRLCPRHEHVSRRAFLKGALATTGGVALPNWGGTGQLPDNRRGGEETR